jgi:anti-sigma-K factor RskA
LRLTAAAAVVGLVAAVAFGVLAARTRHQLDVARDRIAQAQARYGPVGEVLAAPDLHATTATSPTGGVAITMVSARLDKAVLMVSGMPDPPAGHTYQAWVISAAGPRSAGLLRPGPDAVAPPLVFGGLAHGDLVGVTVEPAAGSAKPTTNPVMLFDLPV